MILRPMVTCEHAGNIIPRPYKKFFSGSDKLLESHRGYDIGALELARLLGRTFKCPLHFTMVSRLLVDCNRSPGSRNLFSEISRRFDEKTRGEILARYYGPYRAKVEYDIAAALAAGDTVLHFSVHSFTPVLDGVARNADIGLLYDPSRVMEREFCKRLAPLLERELPGIRIRMNYPYRGSSDGFAAHLRKTHPEKRYLGIEIEMNQVLLAGRVKKTSARSAR
jgi:predicted N-formylglutamate amidohydrolase